MKTRIIGAIVALVLAALGAFVIITYVRGADARAAEGVEQVDVYVATSPIPKGTPADSLADLTKRQAVPKKNLADGYVTDLTVLDGLIADTEILPGEQLLEARFADPADLAALGDVVVPDGMQLVSFTLPADRVVGGQVRAGDKIGLVGSVDGALRGLPNSGPTTEFALHGVLVTKVQGAVVAQPDSDTKAEQGSGDAIMLTIALSAHDIERWVWFTEGEANNYANMWLTLENEKTDNSGTSPVTGSNAF